MADQADITRATLAAQRSQSLASSYASKALQAAQQTKALYDQFLRFASVWRGAWDPATTYSINDMVENEGSSYICVLQNSNQEPPNIVYWDLVAQAGGGGVTSTITSDDNTVTITESPGIVDLSVPVPDITSEDGSVDIVTDLDSVDLSVPPSFGSDTTVQLPNIASTDVAALRLVASLTNNGVGTEVSKWVGRILSAGAAVDGFSVEQTAFGARHRFYFLDDPDTYIEVGSANRLDFVAGGVLLATFNTGGLTLNAGAGVTTVNYGAGSSVSYNGAGSLVLTPGNRHVQIGAAGALAVDAVGGFPTIPTCAGTPNGTPANVASGHAPYIIDSTNHKLYAYYGGAWHDLTGT